MNLRPIPCIHQLLVLQRFNDLGGIFATDRYFSLCFGVSLLLGFHHFLSFTTIRLVSQFPLLLIFGVYQLSDKVVLLIVSTSKIN